MNTKVGAPRLQTVSADDADLRERIVVVGLRIIRAHLRYPRKSRDWFAPLGVFRGSPRFDASIIRAHLKSVAKRFLRIAGCVASLLPSAVAAEPPDTVVLLHELGRTSASMSRLTSALKREGYRVVNVSYPSRGRTLEALATEWLPAQLDKITPPAETVSVSPKIHFVTHSMGGVVVRLWLREKGVSPSLGRVVMLAPPNAGSEVSDRLHDFALFRWFTGKNGRRLGTGVESLPRSLGPWPATAGDLGVIAGDYPLNPIMASWLPGPNDGKVSVSSTHLAGERDHLVLPYSHTWLGYRRETIDQVIAFLRHGKFTRRRSRVRRSGLRLQGPCFAARCLLQP
jgi:triacylglycerol lipase